MKIRMKADISGSRNGKPWPRRGGTVEVPDAEGAELCAAGLAEPVAQKTASVETAVKADDSEQRQDGAKQERQDGATEQHQSGPVTSESASALAKKPPARKAAAKKTAPAKPAQD